MTTISISRDPIILPPLRMELSPEAAKAVYRALCQFVNERIPHPEMKTLIEVVTAMMPYVDGAEK